MIAENVAVEKAIAHNAAIVIAAMRAKSSGVRAGSGCPMPNSDASVTTRNSNVCQAATLRPVRYETSRVTTITWTNSSDRSALNGPPVCSSTHAR